MQIHRLSLQCVDIDSIRAFYVELLGFEMMNDEESALTLRCGDSLLEFHTGSAAYYHFAFNISPDLLLHAAHWLEMKGIVLLPYEQNRIVPFPNWEAEAVYFHDPAGNIVELIARHRLPKSGRSTFSITDVLGISEMGFATYAFEDVFDQLTQEIGIPIFGNSSEAFAALGDDLGLFIVVDGTSKLWIPSMEPAQPFPFTTEIQQDQLYWELNWDNTVLDCTLLPQTFDGEYLYKSIEEQAAHLLYFVIKNHPFTDGNKRIVHFYLLFFNKKKETLPLNSLKRRRKHK